MLIPKENERLKLLIDKYAFGSENSFAEFIGVTQTSINRLFRVDERNGEVPSVLKSKTVLKAINNRYPFVDIEWFLGDGDLIDSIHDINNEGNVEIVKSPVMSSMSKQSSSLIPYYDLDFAAGNDLVLVENDKVTPDYYMDVPEFYGCTAFRAYSNSMEKLIKSGSILFGTKVEEWELHLEYGQIYGIICNDGRRYLKYIRKFKDNPKEFLLLKSENSNYDDFDIPKKSIRSIWLIHGWLNKIT